MSQTIECCIKCYISSSSSCSLFGALILETLYGFEVNDSHNSHIEANEQTVESINEFFITGKYWVDVFPILAYIPEWMPGMSFKHKCARWTEQVMTMRTMPFETARKSFVSVESITAVVDYPFTSERCIQIDGSNFSMNSVAGKIFSQSLYAEGTETQEYNDFVKDVLGIGYAGWSLVMFCSSCY